jgi:hypothetical protein
VAGFVVFEPVSGRIKLVKVMRYSADGGCKSFEHP